MYDKTKQLPGCTDGGCMYGHPGGMHTNGGCVCEKELRRAPGGLKAVREIRMLRTRAEKAERDKQALRALVKKAFCEGMMSAEGASRPLNSDMESAWKHSESRELMERF